MPPPPPPPLDSNSKSKLPDISPGTYVVQVPKDQIYRVPPPENVHIAELHRNSPPKAKNRTCCWCFTFIIVFLVIVLLAGGLLGGLFSIVLTPKDPRFSTQHFLLQKKPHSHYKITLLAQNPNSNVAILYKEGGVISLSLKRQKVASGAYPTFSQSHQNSTQFEVTLKDSTTTLPKEVEESIENDKKKIHVTFFLSINFQAQMKMGLLRSGTMKYVVSCQVTVDTLAKNSRVVSQQCQTKRH